MGRQSSSPDSLYFENIYQLPFFVSAVPLENDGFPPRTTRPGERWYGSNSLKLSKGDPNVVDVVPHNRVRTSLPIVSSFYSDSRG